MKISFHGACKTVTGSCYMIETEDTKLLLDCGMFQGSKDLKERNYGEFNFAPNEIDYVILTHAHIDHSGLIPKLVKKGFKGTIISTKATTDLCSIMLPDSGHIQELEVERKNRKLSRAGEPLIEPIYNHLDAKRSLMHFSTLDYDLKVDLTPTISVRFRDAGHILGSSIVELWIKENSSETKLVFSGDIGNLNQPIIKDPTVIEKADYLIMETTYGNRIHKNLGDKQELLLQIIKSTFLKGGNVIIPAFAVERTQDVLYYLGKLDLEGRLPECKIYVDSPLAISASEIFRVSINYFDEETKAAFDKIWQSPGILKRIVMTRSEEDSIKLNNIKTGAIIISASGMCDAGRIKHHLKHNLWREESSIVFVGYQAPGTLGRQIIDGVKQVRIHGEQIAVNAQIHNLEGFSGHADQKALLHWFDSFKQKPKEVFLVHGEPEGMEVFKNLLLEKYDIKAYTPEFNQSFDLKHGEVKAYDVQGPSEKDAALLYTNIINKLSELYRVNLERQELKQLYEKLKTIERVIQENILK
ncbi:MAG: MBL fold metallo-hydrolase [Tepidanaerobacter acetatoxydans]|uniref:MBL fold metallo-hydrolase RNA specificity domain-containing protein n=1 Tax=Tepidanaerobacter TaxID=499228 RepID=UPI000B2786A2|nr:MULTISPECIES: MBL fold metallo-hydrolase [Tepidanaerobacter]NLU10878.1 MBL fold metallo-hydrolase [Tepidanaerobacter acetatoxydans]